MNDQERQIISDIFQRLEQVAHQPRDPEAERYIADQIRQKPYAPYAMAQAIVVQEEALKNLNAQVQQLQAEVERLKAQGSSSGGFLSSLFGGGSRPEPRPEYRQDPRQGAGGPWGQPQGGYAPQQPGYGQPGYGQPGMGMQPGMMGGQPGMMGGMMPQRQGSGFLGTAMATAAGVAGGVVLGSALSNAFSGAHGTGGQGLFGGAEGAAAGGGSDFSSLSPFGTAGTPTPAADQGGGDFGGGFDQGGADFQDASFDNADFGSDSGGDDWA